MRCDQLRDDLLAGGFSDVDRLYQRDGAGPPTSAPALQQGRSLVNYLGHGTGTGWTSVPFGATDVAALGNTQWPWIVDVSCSNGEFSLPTCFAEAWLRAGTGRRARPAPSPWWRPVAGALDAADGDAGGDRRRTWPRAVSAPWAPCTPRV